MLTNLFLYTFMHSIEGLLTIAQEIVTQASLPEPILINRLAEMCSDIDNEDSDEYNAMVLLCDILFASTRTKYILLDEDDNVVDTISTTCSIDEEFIFPSLEIGTNSMRICYLIRWLYYHKVIDDIYEAYPALIERYVEEVDDDISRYKLVYDDTRKEVTNFKDMFGIISRHKCLDIYEALLSSIRALRK